MFHRYNLLSRHNNQIIDSIASIPNVDKFPIRVLIRPTSEYQTLSHQFLPEEREQLERGDIPFFYTFLGSKDIFYLDTNRENKLVMQNDLVNQDISRSGQVLSFLFCRDRIEKLKNQSIIMFTFRIFEYTQIKSISSKNFSFYVDKNILYVEWYKTKYKSTIPENII
ncbi:MAG: hypothetical protein QE271_02065 [Bacteriovoracaceae bacterium]|nr:hypothetical protein [Bacteriovoracaceae bacterium]